MATVALSQKKSLNNIGPGEKMFLKNLKIRENCFVTETLIQLKNLKAVLKMSA